MTRMVDEIDNAKLNNVKLSRYLPANGFLTRKLNKQNVRNGLSLTGTEVQIFTHSFTHLLAPWAVNVLSRYVLNTFSYECDAQQD